MAYTATASPIRSPNLPLLLRQRHNRRPNLNPKPFLHNITTPHVPSPLLALPRRRRSIAFATRTDASGEGDGGNLQSSVPSQEVGSPNARRSRPEDGYVGLFVRMLGLDNDPLDREQAVSTLWQYSRGGKQCIDEIMQFPGCINLVANLLKSDSCSTCEAAAGLLRTISSISVYRESIAECGAIEEVAAILCQLSLASEVKEQSLCTLWNLSIDEGLREKITKCGLLPRLIKFLDDEEIKVKEAAGGVLANLALSHCNHSTLVEAGVIPKLAQMFKSKDEGYRVIRKEAKNALMELSKDEYYKILIMEEGLIFAPLIGSAAYRSFRPVSHSWPSLPDGTEIQKTSTPSRYGASELLLGLNIREKRELEEAKMNAVVGRSRQQFLIRIGAVEMEDGENPQPPPSDSERETLLPMVDGIARLVLILELEDSSAIARAARAIGDASISKEMRISFKEAGVIPRLIQLLDHTVEGVRESAIYALEKLSVSPEICQMFEAPNVLKSLFSFMKSTDTSKNLKQKTVNILARTFYPGKMMKAEFHEKLGGGSGESSKAIGITQNGNGISRMSDPSSVSQEIVGDLIDMDVICCLIEIMKTSSPYLQRKVASILEYLANHDVHLAALKSAGVGHALVNILQQKWATALKDDHENELQAAEAEETGLVIAAVSRLLAKLLNEENFQQQMDLLPLTDLLRNILRSSNLSHSKEWVAACLVKLELTFGQGKDGESPIETEIVLYETIPRLVEQMKVPSLKDAAVIEVNDIISKGGLDCSRAFASAGGIYPLVELLNKVDGPALEAGLAVLYNLSMDSENHAAIIAAGAIPVLKRIVLSEGPQWTRALHLLRTLPT